MICCLKYGTPINPIYNTDTDIHERMLDSLAKGFERKILFGAGRHLWNIVGVAGVVAIATGGIFALTSPPPEKILSQEDWIKQSSNSK